MKKLPILIFLFMIPVQGLPQSFWYDEMPVYQNGRQMFNPWDGGLITTSISLTDLDHDGDADLFFIGQDEGRINHYGNMSHGMEGQFDPINFLFGGIDLPNQWVNMALYDWDNDGYFDLFLGRANGKIEYYHNTGTSLNFPDFMLESYEFGAINVGLLAVPTFADLDGDGNDDLLVGNDTGGIFYYHRDAGGEPALTFIDTLRDNTGQIIKNVYGPYAPTFADLDADGDPDMLLGSITSELVFYRNTGSATSPEFTLEDNRYIISPRNVTNLTPVLVDIDDDNDYDLFMGDSDGWILYYRNDGTPEIPNFQLITDHIAVDNLDFGRSAAASLVDMDADDDTDFFVSDSYGKLFLMKNTGSPTNPTYIRQTDPFLDMGDVRTVGHNWGDTDNDGDLDLYVGIWLSGSGQIYHFQNIGTKKNAVLDSVGWLTDTNGDNIQASWFNFADMEGDHDLDLFTKVKTPEGMSAIVVYENQGTPEMMDFVRRDTLRDASMHTIEDQDLYFDIVDLDLDGDQDVCVGTAAGRLIYYKNNGTVATWQLQEADRIFDIIDMGAYRRCLPTFGDVDGDDDPDLITGRVNGGFYFYRNFNESNVDIYSENIALGKTAVASMTFEDHSASWAIDGDVNTNWIAGDNPPQWIELDLQSPSRVGKVQLVVDQYPAGETVHHIWSKGPNAGDEYGVLKEFHRTTADLDTLTYIPPSVLENIQFLKIETTVSPSWVGWREIFVYGESSGATALQNYQRTSQPFTFQLDQNYPNPFNPGTAISYQLPMNSNVNLSVYNVNGQLVKTLVQTTQAAGRYRINWDGRDQVGRIVSAGLYMCRLQASDNVSVRRMVLMK
ncbi:VCBS repeat-containing protein [candidate division KSB1 bacterium]|nr:VCBS repeat-containing protein [candidate division KSB1 bacterium]